MARFESRNVSTADVAAPRQDVWALVSSPDALARLTPLVTAIVANGERWCWQLMRLSIAGVHVQPLFTEAMSFDDGRRIGFDHRPPSGRVERGGATGVYLLADGPKDGTHLSVDITLHIDLPLPAISRRAVEGVMASLMTRTGKQFAENLCAALGLGSPPADTLASATR